MQLFAHIFAYMKSTNFNSYESINALGLSFFGLQLYQLFSIINDQGNQMLESEELNIPSRTASTLMLLKTTISIMRSRR